jgi:hypothetical protein
MSWDRAMVSIAQQTTRKDDTVSKIVDKVLNQIFGREATILIYKHLEHRYHLKRNEVGEKIEVFAQGLEDFLRSGAYVIERKILEDIHSNYSLLHRLELEKVSEETDFVNQVKLFARKA